MNLFFFFVSFGLCTMSLPKGVEGFSIDASTSASGYDSRAVTQPASALPSARHAGGVMGGVLVILKV